MMTKTTQKTTRLEKVLLQQGLTEKDAIKLLSGHYRKPSRKRTFSTDAEDCKYIYFSDAHIGEKHFDEPLFYQMIDTIKEEKPDFVIDVGDHLEGMSGRPGHVYELDLIGFDEQFKKAV